MQQLTSQNLVKAKSIIDRAFAQGALTDYDASQDQQVYCALGAIGRAYTKDDSFDYEDIPSEDMVVLACVIDADAVDGLISKIKTFRASPMDIQSIIIDFNDDLINTKEDVAMAFKEGCKNYHKYTDKIKEFYETDLAYNKHLNEIRLGSNAHDVRKTTLRWAYLA